MWVKLQFLRAEFDSPDRQLLGLSDMEIVSISGRKYLLVAGAADAGLSSYEILSDGSLRATDDILLSVGSGTLGVADLTVFYVDGMAYVLPSGKTDDNQVVYAVLNGDLGNSASYVDPVSFDKWEFTTAVVVDGNSYIFGSAWNQSGFFQFDVAAGGVLTNPQIYADTEALFLEDVQAISSAKLHGKANLFVASGLDAGLHNYAVASDGTLTLLDTVARTDVGFAAITAVAAVDVGARAFVVVASAGTDSLMVMRVSDTGKMNLVERLVDDNTTRFADASVLEMFQYGGRYFMVAAGSDDGISLFEITYKGQLDMLATIADTENSTLDNVTDVEVTVQNGKAYIFVSSATDHGFSEFVVKLPSTTNLIYGADTGDRIVGTTGDDTIYGLGHGDMLYGRNGDDHLIDGRGNDYMWGGNGADVFEFTLDGRKDYIMDFEIGVDRIDLRDLPLLYHYSAITIHAKTWGARLEARGEVIFVYSDDGSKLKPEMFDQDDFIFG